MKGHNLLHSAQWLQKINNLAKKKILSAICIFLYSLAITPATSYLFARKDKFVLEKDVAPRAALEESFHLCRANVTFGHRCNKMEENSWRVMKWRLSLI